MVSLYHFFLFFVFFVFFDEKQAIEGAISKLSVALRARNHSAPPDASNHHLSPSLETPGNRMSMQLFNRLIFTFF
jgi:hypothetical protein